MTPDVIAIDPTSQPTAPVDGFRAVTYLRVSTMGQDNTDYDADGFSIAAQRDACRKKAEPLGAVIIEEYVDKGEPAIGVHGGDAGR